MNILSYIPYAKDAGLLLVHCAGYAVLTEDPEKEGKAKRLEAIKAIKEQLAQPGGFDLPGPLNNDFSIGLALDVSVKLLNMVGFSKFFSGLKSGLGAK